MYVKFWFAKSDNWSDLFIKKMEVWSTSIWYQIHCGLQSFELRLLAWSLAQFYLYYHKLSVPCQKPSVIMYFHYKNCLRLFDMSFISSVGIAQLLLQIWYQYMLWNFVDCLDDIVNFHEMSQKQYFTERCEGDKNQHFWPTIKQFISSRHDINIDIYAAWRWFDS